MLCQVYTKFQGISLDISLFSNYFFESSIFITTFIIFKNVIKLLYTKLSFSKLGYSVLYNLDKQILKILPRSFSFATSKYGQCMIWHQISKIYLLE